MVKAPAVITLLFVVLSSAGAAKAQGQSPFTVPQGWRRQQEGVQTLYTAPAGSEGLSISPAAWIDPHDAPGVVLAKLLNQYERKFPDLKIASACRAAPTLATAIFYRQGDKGQIGEQLIVNMDPGGVKIATIWAPGERFPDEEPKIASGIPACPPLAQGPDSATAALPAPQFTDWRDPIEGAFSVSVPKGWTTKGGMRRPSPMDPRPFVTLQSPDGSIRVFMGDPGIGTFEAPDPVRARMGYRPGQTIPAGRMGAIAVTLEPYIPGPQFAVTYVRGQCRDARIVSQTPLAEEGRDLANGVKAANPGVPAKVTATAGSVSFDCNGRQGGVLAGTVAASPPGPGIQLWTVPLLAGYSGSDGAHAAQAEAVMKTLVASFKYDAAWEQRFNAEAGATTKRVMGDQNAILAGVQARAKQEASSSLNHPNTFVPHSGVVPPADTSGNKTMCSALDACQPVSTDHTYYWIDNSQNIVPGPETGAPPDNSGSWYRMEQR